MHNLFLLQVSRSLRISVHLQCAVSTGLRMRSAKYGSGCSSYVVGAKRTGTVSFIIPVHTLELLTNLIESVESISHSVKNR
jgi:hypothetical protein